MNTKAQTVAIGIVFGLVFLMFAVLLVPFIGDEVTRTTATTQLNCNNMTISDGNKLTCLGVDAVIPYFLIIVVTMIFGGAMYIYKRSKKQ